MHYCGLFLWVCFSLGAVAWDVPEQLKGSRQRIGDGLSLLKYSLWELWSLCGTYGVRKCFNSYPYPDSIS